MKMRLHLNEKQLVKFGDFYLTNVRYDMAYRYGKEHDTVISIVHNNDLRYDWTHFQNLNHFVFDNIQDKFFHDDDTSFNKTMRGLYNLISEITEGKHGNRILIHCLAGISRSSALTLWIMAHINKDMKAHELFDFLLSKVNHLANPNESMLKWIAFNDNRAPSLKEFTQLKREI